MRRPTLFLITGFSRAGKDTLADALVDQLTGARKVAFADPLKDAANLFLERLNLHGLADLRTDADKVRHRDFLVAGGKMARALRPTVFADLAAGRARDLLLAGRCAVISDWRYLNELEAATRACCPHVIRTVYLGRRGLGPANEEEAINVTGLEPLCDTREYFEDGDTGGISDLAHDLANEVPEVPGA